MNQLIEFDPSTIRHIVFDVDGTIIHGTDEIKTEVWETKLFPLEKDRIRKVNQLFDMQMPYEDGAYYQGDRYDRIALMFGLWHPGEQSHRTNAQVLDYARRFEAEYKSLSDGIKIDDADMAALETLSSLMKIHVASNVPIEVLIMQLKRWGVFSYFSSIYGKPRTKIEALQSIMSHYNLLAEHVLLVGDSDVDLSAAEEIGCQFCVINNDKLTKRKGDLYMNRIHHLVPYFS